LLDCEVPPRPDDLVGKRLYTILDLAGLKTTLQFRIDDLEKMVAGALSEMENITSTMDVITCKQTEAIWRSIMSNTNTLVDACAADERGAAALEVMEIIFSASMGFDIWIRMFGIDQGIDTEAAGWHMWMLQHIVWVPGGWGCCNMFFTFLVCYAMKKYMAYLGGLATNYVQCTKEVNQPMSFEMLENYLRNKTLESSSGDDKNCINKIVWEEEDEDEWGGAPPKIQICFDDINEFFLWVRLDVDKKRVVLPEAAEANGDDIETWVTNRFLEILTEAEVLFELGKKPAKTKLGGMLGQ